MSKKKEPKNTPDLCLGCKAKLHAGGYIRNPVIKDTQASFTPVFYCDTPTCIRYGLLSIYRISGTGKA